MPSCTPSSGLLCAAGRARPTSFRLRLPMPPAARPDERGPCSVAFGSSMVPAPAATPSTPAAGSHSTRRSEATFKAACHRRTHVGPGTPLGNLPRLLDARRRRDCLEGNGAQRTDGFEALFPRHQVRYSPIAGELLERSPQAISPAPIRKRSRRRSGVASTPIVVGAAADYGQGLGPFEAAGLDVQIQSIDNDAPIAAAKVRSCNKCRALDRR